MARARVYAAVLDEAGNVQPNKPVAFYEMDGSPLAMPIYATEAGGVPELAPQTNSLGVLTYFADQAQRAQLSVDGSATLKLADFEPDWGSLLSGGDELGVPDGTLPAPGAFFTNEPGSGIRRIGAASWSTVVNGNDALRMRVGPKGFVQYGLGKMDGGPDGWLWEATSPGTIAHFQLNQTSASQGDVNAAVFSVTSIANAGGAGAVPDSSAISCFFSQPAGTAGNGAGRAVEAQITRDTDANTDPSATIWAIEAGVHSSADGNHTLYDKIGGINMLFTGAGLSRAAKPADTGLYIHGDGGVLRPIYYRHEVPGAPLGECFIVDMQGHVLASPVGNAGQPTYAFTNEPSTGVFRPATGALAFSTAGVERARLTSDGLGVGTVPVAGNRLATAGGDCLFTSGASNRHLLFQFGRTAPEAAMILIGVAGQYAAGAQLGDLVVRSDTQRVLIASGGNEIITVGTNALSFFGGAPVARAAAYTQTYAGAGRTHATLTSATLASGAGAPQSGTADVGAITGQTTINNNFATLVDQVNKLRADLLNTRDVLNSVIDDFQAYRLLA